MKFYYTSETIINSFY